MVRQDMAEMQAWMIWNVRYEWRNEGDLVGDIME